MWLELAVGALALVAAWQTMAIWLLRKAVLKAPRVVYPAEAFTDVPTSMLVEALARIEQQLKDAPSARHAATSTSHEPEAVRRPIAAMAAPPLASNYDLARELLREGARVDELVQRCGLSRGEAELLRNLHEAGERLAADARHTIANHGAEARLLT
ncbi:MULTISPECIES: DUF2802 domain-containing protein [Dyella]|uniref:DUF2802 domain-containing protein n=2 Tax=Dyella TaxID=231454 RepID=A0A4R0YMJ4_9GAMM|nr:MULTISPECIES: DUF2802 domain-containing protein [Dyella]TBR37219.1 DUF2802 domain-containing protein [Dyella terrae]TCI07691.1 DUF2802 domain-containing protein [Dyella soli]